MKGLGLRGEYDIKVGRKKYLLKFGTNSAAVFCEEYDIGLTEFQEVMQNPGPNIIRDFLWSAAVAGCYTNQKEVDFTKMDVGDWIDDLEDGELEKIFDVIDEASDPGEVKNSTGPKAT